MKALFASLLLVLALPLAAQATHTATLPIGASPDSTTSNPGTVTVYRATGTCPTTGLGALTFTAVTTSAPASGSYVDTLPGPGTYCYYLTATISGATSGASGTGGGTATPFPPTLGTVVVK